jgi:hypothetical protein
LIILSSGNQFLLGANLAWLDGQYDHDFGANQVLGINTAAFDDPTHRSNMISYLQDMKAMGIKVVRLWVFEKFEGLLFDNQGFVTGVDQTLVDNLAELCDLASNYDISFYLCLMDTWGVWRNNLAERTAHIGIINGLITVGNKTISYLNKAVIPLLSNAKIKNRVFAVDVLNEPEGLDREKTMQDNQFPVDTGITWNQLVFFITNCLDIIKSRTGLAVSCGFQDVSTVQGDPNGFSDHLDFFDFHRYKDTWDLPDYSALGIAKPCIIGECGQETVAWNDNLQLNTLTSFLNNARDRGYWGCFPWCYNYKGFTDLNGNYLSLINGDGSHRPVCQMISQFAQNLQ